MATQSDDLLCNPNLIKFWRPLVDTSVTTFLSSLVYGPMQQFERMAVIPLSSTPGGPAYLTLAEAQGRQLITVSEVTEGGSVPELRVESRAKVPVLLLDGEELAGAKQNRVLNTSILLKKQSTTIVPVSCTEQGRWSYTSAVFADSGHLMSPHLRSAKSHSVSESLACDRRFDSDQGRVWNEIEKLHRRAGTDSPTRAMRDVHEAKRTTVDQYLAAFSVLPGQTGILVIIDGAVVGMDILSRPEAFAQIGPKLLRSYALDAVVGAKANGPKPTVAAAEGFVAVVSQIKPKKYRSIGHGSDYRYNADRMVGSALVYRKQVIHAAFFPIVAGVSGGTMMGPRWRANRTRPPVEND